jgi:molybdopterin/thiamine biosynthesis adenylyltransferase
MSAEPLHQRITVIGAGAIGCALLPLLAGIPGVVLHLVDGDTVEAANLPRQPLYGPADQGRLKVEVARERLQHGRPERRVEQSPVFIGPGNAHDLLRGSSLVCDCTDDLPARLLVDRCCSELGIPLVSGAVHRQQVQVATLHVAHRTHGNVARLKDLFPGRVAQEQEGCLMQQVPVHVTTLAAAVMARHVEALLRNDRSLAGVLELVDVAAGRWMRIEAPHAPFDEELIARSTIDGGASQA